MDKKIIIGGGAAIAALLLFASRGSNSGGGGASAQAAAFNNASILSNLETNRLVAAAQPQNVKATADLMAHLSDNRVARIAGDQGFILSALDMSNQTTAVSAASLAKIVETTNTLPLARISAASGGAAVELEKVKGANALELAKLGFDPGTGGSSLFGGSRAGISPTTGKSYSSMNDWEKNMQWALDFNNSNAGQAQKQPTNNSWIGQAISAVVGIVGALIA